MARWVVTGLPTHNISRSLELGTDPLTVVRAPMGFGKSNLLAQWCEDHSTEEHSPLWITVESDWVSWDILGSHFLVSLDPSSDDRYVDLAQLEAKLTGVPKTQRVLFVDQADRLAPGVLRHLICVFTMRFENPWQVVLATRSVLDDSVMSVAKNARLIGLEQLAFTESEVQAIVMGRAQHLSRTSLETVARSVSGWALGANIAANAIAGDPDPERVAREFSGKDLELAFAFESDAFASLDRGDQEFLIRSSVLCELSTEACIAVTSDQFSFDRLGRLARKNGLVYSDGDSFRFVPFARDFLMQKLEGFPADEVEELLVRSIRWHLDRAEFAKALQHASDVGHWQCLIDLTLEHGLDLVALGHGGLVLRCIRNLPSEAVQFESGIAVVGAVASWAFGYPAAASATETADWLALASTYRSGRPPRGASTVNVAVDSVLAAFGGFAPEDRVTLAERVLREQTGPSDWTAICSSALGLARFLADDLPGARRALAACLQSEASPSGRTPFGESIAVASAYIAALIESESGDSERFDFMLALARTQGRDIPVLPVAVTGLVEARWVLCKGDAEAAAKQLVGFAGACRTRSLRALAWIDAADAFETLGRNDDRLNCLAETDALTAQASGVGQLVLRRRKHAERVTQTLTGSPDSPDSLTERELEVLRLLQSDLSRREIASQMFVAHNTVKTYVQRLYRKLGVTSRPAAIVQARERGWI